MVKTATAMKTAYSGNNSNINKYRSLNDVCHSLIGFVNNQNYIATFVAADVHVEDSTHPVMKNIPHRFHVAKEEWYTWNKSPRPNVHVLATVDESTYDPDSKIKMGGDHPVVWTNEHFKARNVYIFMGHSPVLFESDAYKQLFRNAIFWAAGIN